MTPAHEDLIERIRRMRAAREAGATTVPGGAPQDPGTRTPAGGEPDDPVVRVRELVADRLARRQRRPLEALLEAMPRPEPVARDVATVVLPAARDTIPAERALPPRQPAPGLRATPEPYEADPDRVPPAPSPDVYTQLDEAVRALEAQRDEALRLLERERSPAARETLAETIAGINADIEAIRRGRELYAEGRMPPAPTPEPAPATPPARRDPTDILAGLPPVDSASAPWAELQSALNRAAAQDATRQPSIERIS